MKAGSSGSWVPGLVTVLSLGCSGATPAVTQGMDAQVDASPVADAASDMATDATATDAAPVVYPMPSAANAVPPTDPGWGGQYEFLYDAFGTEVLGEWPPVAFMLSLVTSEPAVFGNQFAQFGFVPDPHDDLPYGFKRGRVDPTQVHETCAVCHTAALPDGRVWFGMPNTTLDLGRFQLAVNQRWMAAGHPSLLTANGTLQDGLWGPGRAEAAGDVPYSIPVDYPAYFNLGTRPYLNTIGTSRDVRTESSLSIYTFGAGSPNAATARVPFPSRDTVDLLVSFLSTLDAPTPPAQDAAQVARGQTVFQSAGCAGCHHVDMPSMDAVVTYATTMGPELLPGANPMFPHGTIRTDPMNYQEESGGLVTDGGMGDATAGMGVTGLNDLIGFILHNGLRVTQTDGYNTPLLHGLAFTAPYLHNGSVPTLAALLQPAAMRPATFPRGRFTVDTSLRGNSNMGHEFGTTLPDADKTALVAYLHSL